MITGAVARILDRSTLIINRGEKDGVKTGMRFVIYAEVDEVKDPETGESLGKWEVVKGRIHALHVQERLTVCRAGWPRVPDEQDEDEISTHTLSGELVEASFSLKDGSPRSKDVRLEVDRSAMVGIPKAGPVKVGDRVRSAG